ncbi:InlB B-repeat-containing protein [Robiginitalea sp.]|uniref:InlB B-repeat-containing protein n=1 Tax=Robiginitalea sp. TaxID=1902411 RepID=UPI003C766296
MGTFRFFKLFSVFVLVFFIGCSDEKGDEDSFEPLSREEVNLTIEIIPEGSGIVLPVSGSYTKGRQLTLRAIPNEGYLFSYWEDGFYSSKDTHSITLDSDKTITAPFFERNNDFRDLR